MSTLSAPTRVTPSTTGAVRPPLLGFTMRLTTARFASRQGESLLYLASTLAYVICSALAFTVAGGTWMFHQRWANPRGIHAEFAAADPDVLGVLSGYVGLAALACALLVPAMVGLAGSAAVLGARGRERRMSALRLLGLSSGDVTRMALVDTAVQAVIGTLIGFVIYLVSLPAWSALTIQAMRVDSGEMLLPWWLALLVAVATLVIGVVASWWGMRQVRVSPLGVARRSSSPALRWWRPVAFVALVSIGIAAVNVVDPEQEIGPWIIMGVALVAVIGGMNLVGPWVLQVVCRLLARTGSPAVMWAARRVQAEPRATWGRVAGLGLLAFVGGYTALMPIATEPPPDAPPAAAFAMSTSWDMTKGVAITLAVGLVVAATATYITQASAVFARAEQSRALQKMGAAPSYLRRVAWLEVFGPLVLALALGTTLGVTLAAPMAANAASAGYESQGTGPVVMMVVLGAGLAFSALALMATAPLQRQVLAEQRRRAD